MDTGTTKDPIAFSDLRTRERAERKALSERRRQLQQAEKSKKALSDAEKLELEEIERKLAGKQVVDPLFKAVQAKLRVEDHDGGKLPSQEKSPGELRPEEKRLAAVYGILEADREEPPEYHLAIIEKAADDLEDETTSYDPTAERREQRFGRALFAAVGEYETNQELFEAVLPILIRVGSRLKDEDVVNAEEWAQTVRYLLKRRVTARDYQLERKVNEALDVFQNVGEDLPPSLIEIDLPNLEDETDNEIIADNIRALQPAYFSAMFEELKVYQVVDKLVELFQNGVLPIGRGEAGNLLFRYWKDTASRVSEAERRSFYARALGIVGGDDGGSPNREFNDLWMRFVSAVCELVRQERVEILLKASTPAPLNQQQVRKAARDLATNLSLHGYGMAHFMATELQKQVKDVIKLLGDPDVRNAYGARDMWQVIDQVATLELGGSRNSVRYRTMAASGAIIMAWLADRAAELSASYGALIDITEINNPTQPPRGYKPTAHPSDLDLVNACEQWLAVTGTQEEQVETYAQPKEAPNMTTKPIQIPAIARDMLESVGVQGMGLANVRESARYH